MNIFNPNIRTTFLFKLLFALILLCNIKVYSQIYNTLAYNKINHIWYDRYYYNLSSSATIKGNYNNNVFTINTSRVTKFEILISPEMVNLNKEIKVIVNGKTAFMGEVKPNKSFLVNQFIKNQDKKAIWVNSILIDVKP